MNFLNFFSFFFILLFIISARINCIKLCKKIPTVKDAKNTFPLLFNLTYIKETTHNYEYFQVYLKESKKKGIGIFASRLIPANRTLVYYKLKVFQKNKYTRFNGGEYSFIVYKDFYKKDLDKIADIYKYSNAKPKARKPFWVCKFLFLKQNFLLFKKRAIW